MGDRDLTVADVEREHLAEVNPWAHAAYVAAVLGGGTVLMLILIAWLASGGS